MCLCVGVRCGAPSERGEARLLSPPEAWRTRAAERCVHAGSGGPDGVTRRRLIPGAPTRVTVASRSAEAWSYGPTAPGGLGACYDSSRPEYAAPLLLTRLRSPEGRRVGRSAIAAALSEHVLEVRMDARSEEAIERSVGITKPRTGPSEADGAGELARSWRARTSRGSTRRAMPPPADAEPLSGGRPARESSEAAPTRTQISSPARSLSERGAHVVRT